MSKKKRMTDKDNYDSFFKDAHKDIKEELLQLKKIRFNEIVRKKREDLHESIKADIEHHELMKICGQVFANNSPVSLNTGYRFFCTEPLVEFSSDEKGNRVFDLLILNKEENASIFVECKSSFGKDKTGKVISQVEDAKKLVFKKIDHLSKIIETDLDPNKIEFAVCVFTKDFEKLTQYYERKMQGDNPKAVKFWCFYPHSSSLDLFNKQSHKNSELTAILSKGYDISIGSRIELPFYYNMLQIRVFKNLILAECYRDNYNRYRENLIDDPKVITKSQIFNTLHDVAAFGADEIKKTDMINRKIKTLASYCQKCNLIEPYHDDQFKLICHGIEPDIVISNLCQKYYRNRPKLDAEEVAKEKAFTDYKKAIQKKIPPLDKYNGISLPPPNYLKKDSSD